MKWLCQHDPATTVYVEGVPKGWVVSVLFLILWLLCIRSKSARSIEVCVIASVRSPSCSGEGGVVSEAILPSPGETTHDHLMAISRQRLIMSGDVETKTGPLDQGRCGLYCHPSRDSICSVYPCIADVERLLSTVDDTTFGKCTNNKRDSYLSQ